MSLKSNITGGDLSINFSDKNLSRWKFQINYQVNYQKYYIIFNIYVYGK